MSVPDALVRLAAGTCSLTRLSRLSRGLSALPLHPWVSGGQWQFSTGACRSLSLGLLQAVGTATPAYPLTSSAHQCRHICSEQCRLAARSSSLASAGCQGQVEAVALPVLGFERHGLPRGRHPPSGEDDDAVCITSGSDM